MTNPAKKPACVGRERNCTQCGAVYRSPRNSSRYCSPACRKKANRGTAPAAGPKAGPEAFAPITRALIKLGFVGQVGPASIRSTEPPVYALLVPFEFALDELSFQFNRRGLGYLSRDKFALALKADGIRGHDTRSPAGHEAKLWQDRQRQRISRAA